MAKFLSRVHADDRELYESMARRINLTGESVDFEYRIYLPDGDIRYLHERCDPVFDDTGMRIRTIGTIQDITERKRGEIALHESSARLRAFFENVPSSISIKDLDGRIVLANRSFGKMIDLPHEDVIGMISHELFDEDIRDRLLSADQEVLKTGKAVEWEYGSIVDGSMRARNLLKFPVRDEAGNIIAIGSISTDITELKRNEEFLRSIVDSLPQALNITDAEGRFVLINRRLSDYFGVEQAYMIGKQPDEVSLRWLTTEQERREIERVFKTGVAITGSENKYEIDGKYE